MNRILSPHLDDAVLSLGSFMQTEPCGVWTIFAGVPGTHLLTDYDRDNGGWQSSYEAMLARRAEDTNACAMLGIDTVVHNDFLDQQYRRQPVTASEIASVLREMWSDEEHVFAPLGIGHPDHRLVADAALLATPFKGEVLLYEDFPYRTMWPEQVAHALELAQRAGFHTEVWPLQQGTWERKREVIACYRSQFPDEHIDYAYAVPERVWRATR